MNYKIKRVLLLLLIVLLNAVLWKMLISRESDYELQEQIYNEAKKKLEDKVYVGAIPLLEDAITFDTDKTKEIEEVTKDTYLKFLDKRDYRKKYVDLSLYQIERDQDVDVYKDLSEFYFLIGEKEDALDLLASGISITGNEELVQIFENNRYEYELSRYGYDEVTSIYGPTITVKINGKWGLAKYSGQLLIPAIYDNISTYSNGAVIVEKDDEIFAVNLNNYRMALLHSEAEHFGNLMENRVPIKTKDGWTFGNSKLTVGKTYFEEVLSFSNGYAPAKKNGKWGFIDYNFAWFIEPIYDEIIVDELGKGYAQNAFFVRKGKEVKLIVDGIEINTVFEDARPFNNSLYAAVKRNGKWGFINTTGEDVIPFEYEDALSYSDGLAAIKKDDMWGYISPYGEMAIKPTFEDAKSFGRGSAPVFVDSSWRMIKLDYYK